ncbi:acyl-CoA dehydrogenase family protein [Pimelobacter simplex]|uniref:acyl-CoA dehydrogenase family protein n=1 Tax=Nocardioides simplex TaxID=2045 RepID=UPI0013763610|nr:acyl-CoA dehydrogenase family protein [Pimelobacter simplex]
MLLPPWDDEQQALVTSFSRFCRERLAAGLPDAARADPAAVRPLLKALLPFGLGNGRVPATSGGLGLDAVTAGLLLEAGVEHAYDVVTPAFINETVAVILARHGQGAVRERYLAPLLAAERIGCTANTEPSGGSDVGQTATRATPTATGFRLRGTKVWITNGHLADFAVVLARSDESGALDLYVVDREAHGYLVDPLVTNGETTTAQLTFDVEVPRDHRLATDGGGLGAMLSIFQEARALVAITAIGLAQAAQASALAYTEGRVLFGAPLTAKQLVQAKLADSDTEIAAARGLAFHALALKDHGRPFDLASARAKLFATEMAQRVVDRSQQLLGGYGTTPDHPVERLARLVAMSRIYEGPSDVQRLIIGRALTGRAAF